MFPQSTNDSDHPLGIPPEPPAYPHKKLLIGLVVLVVLMLVMGAMIIWQLSVDSTPKNSKASQDTTSQTNTATAKTDGLVLDGTKNYGNRYANGILPVGDGKYTTEGAKKGYVYTCSGYANNLKNDQGGAGSRGPWFISSNSEYDLNKKLHVQGNVMWQASFSNKVSGTTRTIVTNNLPSHATGVFPISAADPAYAYDRNPNKITGQTSTYQLSASPSYGSAKCMGGEAGIMLSGISLFNGFDAGGRDAGAWEVQDSCDGHPQVEGKYHYHTLSSCIHDIAVQTVIGFGLDGFPITGPKVGENNILTTTDLDECHGLVSEVILDGKKTTTYHYVMTQDFPYSLSCFRAQPYEPAKPAQGTGPNNEHKNPRN